MLKIDLKPGEAIRIGDAIVTLEAKSGQVARLAIQADRNVPVARAQRPSSHEAAKEGIAVRP